MRIRTSSLAFAFTLLGAASASAQAPDWVTQLIHAAQLPVSANAARHEGVPASDVRAVLDAMRNKNVRAGEARDVLDEARAARREHGPVDNFGAFVQTKLDAGLRGRELAAAIRAEHAARGRGSKSATAATKGKASARDTARPVAKSRALGRGKRPPQANKR